MFHALIRHIKSFKKTNKLKMFIHNFNILPAIVIHFLHTEDGKHIQLLLS